MNNLKAERSALCAYWEGPLFWLFEINRVGANTKEQENYKDS